MLSVGESVGRYVIEDFLGGGQFGEVYLVTDRALSRQSALKVIKTNNAKVLRTLVEAQAQHLCAHDHCVEVRSADIRTINRDVCVIIEMEYLDRGSLQAKLKRNFLSCHEAVFHIKQVLYALEYAHMKNILHRDLKPANILLGNPHTKLSDFGIATDVGGIAYQPAYTYAAHAAPEIAAGAPPSVAADVFSAGMTLFRLINNIGDWDMALGRLSDLDLSIRRGSLVNDLGFMATIPDKLRRVIRKACHSDVMLRYQTAAEFRQALDRLRFRSNWVRENRGHWTSDLDKNEEIRVISPASVQYRVNGRRKVAQCRKFNDIRSARTYVQNFVASNTLLP